MSRQSLHRILVMAGIVLTMASSVQVFAQSNPPACEPAAAAPESQGTREFRERAARLQLGLAGVLCNGLTRLFTPADAERLAPTNMNTSPGISLDAIAAVVRNHQSDSGVTETLAGVAESNLSSYRSDLRTVNSTLTALIETPLVAETQLRCARFCEQTPKRVRCEFKLPFNASTWQPVAIAAP